MGLGRVLGHAMMGYGKGAAMAAESEAAARESELEHQRRVALENLRAQNDSTARSTDLIKIDAQEGVTERTDNRRHAQDKEIANVTSSLRRTETAEQLKLADKLDRAAKTGDVHAVEVDGATGEKVIVYRNGKRERTGIMATQRELTGSSSMGASTLDLARGGGLGTAAPAPAASTAPTTKPNAQQTGKTYTMADARATAKQHGVSVEEVHKRMREAGYRLAGQ